jgi:hypothetical protein
VAPRQAGSRPYFCSKLTNLDLPEPAFVLVIGQEHMAADFGAESLYRLELLCWTASSTVGLPSSYSRTFLSVQPVLDVVALDENPGTDSMARWIQRLLRIGRQ